MFTKLLFPASLSCILLSLGCTSTPSATQNTAPLGNERHYIHDYTAVGTDSNTVHVVVEIPAGTSAKWEVNKESGQLEWERIGDDSLRTVNYLAYPANYGMIPQTLLPASAGGDGDPLDVIVLGPALEQGSVVPCRLIGVMELLDGGEQDDKLLAVSTDSHFATIKDITDLAVQYPGVLDILQLWFSNYKGPTGNTEIKGIADRERAMEILRYAMEGYAQEN